MSTEGSNNRDSRHTVNVKGVNVTGSTGDYLAAAKVGAAVLATSEIGPDGSVKVNPSSKNIKDGLNVAKKFEYADGSDHDNHSSSPSAPSNYSSYSSNDDAPSAPPRQITTSMSTEPSAPPTGPKPLVYARDISIDITHTFPVSSPNHPKPIYYYVMEVTAKGYVMNASGHTDETQPVVRSWTIPKRFSEFLELHKTLSTYCTTLPAAPDKALLFNSSMDSLVAKRRVELKDMMAKILELPFALATSYVTDFLMVNNYVTLDRSGLPRLMQHITHGNPSYGYNCFLYDRLAGILITASESTVVQTKLTNKFFSLKSMWSGPSPINLEGNTAPAPNTTGMLNCYVLDQRSQSWSCAYRRHFDANVSALAWNINERRVYAGFQNGQVAVYHASPNFDEFSLVEASHPHSQRVDALVYIHEKDLLVSCGRDSTLVLQRASAPELKKVYELKVNEGRLCSAVYDATNDYLFIGTGSSKLLVYDMSQATPTLVHLLSGHADAVRALYQCPQSGYLVSGSFDATCQIWTTSAPTGAASMSGLQRRTASIGSFVGTKSKIKSVAICNSANFIATGHDNGAILLWDSHNGLINFVLHDHSSSVVDMQWVDSQNTLISAGRDGKIFFYTVQPSPQ